MINPRSTAEKNDKPKSTAEKKEDKRRNKPGEDYLCWPRGNKAIIALWGSCKKASLRCCCCCYMWSPALDFPTFRALHSSFKSRSNVSLASMSGGGSSFPNVYFCIWFWTPHSGPELISHITVACKINLLHKCARKADSSTGQSSLSSLGAVLTVVFLYLRRELHFSQDLTG